MSLIQKILSLKENPDLYDEVSWSILTESFSSEEYHHAMKLAIAHRLSDIALALLDYKKVKPNYTYPEGKTMLMMACNARMEYVALSLIETGESMPGQTDTTGSTAIMYACGRNLPNVAFALIQTGEANLAQVNDHGNTALLVACSMRMSDVALAMIATGESNAVHVNKDGLTALNYAYNVKALPLIRALEKELNIDSSTNRNANGFEFNEQEHYKVGQYLSSSPDHISVKLNQSYFLTSRPILQQYLNNPVHLKYGCLKAGILDRANFNKTLTLQLSLFGLQVLVPVEDLLMELRKPKARSFYLGETTQTFPSIVSHAFLTGDVGVGTDHCMSGKEVSVFRMFESVLVDGDSEEESTGRESTGRESTGRENNAFIKVQYKTEQFVFPITESTTLDAIKHHLLDTLREKGTTFHAPKVQFMYKGHRYQDGSMPLTALENPAHQMTLQAMITQTTGGSKRRRKRRCKSRKKRRT